MTTGPVQDSAPNFSLHEAALRLDVEEATIREWLSAFNWERHYNGQGAMYLTLKDVEFLRVIKSLKEVDRSCDSIVRIIGGEDLLSLDVVPATDEEVPAPDPLKANLEQVETLKAELKELHAKPAKKKPFWKFW